MNLRSRVAALGALAFGLIAIGWWRIPWRPTGPPLPGISAAAVHPTRALPSTVAARHLGAVGGGVGVTAGCCLEDQGIFADQNGRVELRSPEWLVGVPGVVVGVEGKVRQFRYVDHSAVAFEVGSKKDLWLGSVSPQDPDGDGIPSSLDVLIGAKKAVLVASPYRETYRVLDYPNGDVPRDEGVCTDVVIRALRNAGYDLQSLIQEDRKLAPRAYPGIAKPDPNIDHRRVRNLLSYFQRHFLSLSANVVVPDRPLLPGDILLFDTMNDSRPEHMGIVSDVLGKSRLPLVINSWTTGYVTEAMDLLPWARITHRFRVREPDPIWPASERGLSGLLGRLGIEIPSGHRQIVLSVAPSYQSTYGELMRFTQAEGGAWKLTGQAIPTRLGKHGLARGDGICERLNGLEGLRKKEEGDLSSPLGLFELGVAFGRDPKPPGTGTTWPWRMASATDAWVDDPESKSYNTWQTTTQRPVDWRSAERLLDYRLAVVIAHNQNPVRKGGGSAHFLHDSRLEHATSGCTAVEYHQLARLIEWLDPGKKPLLLQVAGMYFP